MRAEAVIGLEVHVQLLTKAKLFCSCPTDFGAEANTRVCPVCLGLPGSLPVLNQEAVILAVRAALALGCTINPRSSFDRKHYFYPDLPKGYQITQQHPLAQEGRVDTPFGPVDLARLHLEEDAGKLVHTTEGTLIDFNRSGLPLAEIVTKPCLTSASQARAFLESLRQVLLYAHISDCRMEEGSLRCDANISLRGGGRTEIKNLNSFRAVERALEYEIKRHSRALAQGEEIASETLRWDEAQARTVPMRTKEDYCFLPEPDLLPLRIGAGILAMARKDMPEFPLVRAARFVREHALPTQSAGVLTQTRAMADCFEQVVASGAKPRAAANLLLGEVSRLINQGRENVPSPLELARLLALQEEGSISATAAKEVLAQMFASGESADSILQRNSFSQLSDSYALENLAKTVIAQNPKPVADYLGGKKKAFGYLMGLALKESGGRANPGLLKEILTRKLLEKPKKN